MVSRSILFLTAVVIFSLLTANSALAQERIEQNENLPTLPPLMRNSPNHSDVFVDNDQTQREQAAQAAAMRVESIKRDSLKLAQMSDDLKDELGKSGHIFSLDAIKKAGQIEKLAHSLKQRMKE
jgi:acyl carrier protein